MPRDQMIEGANPALQVPLHKVFISKCNVSPVRFLSTAFCVQRSS